MRKAGIMVLAAAVAIGASGQALPQIIAHRGGSKEQDENTLSGFKGSYEKGARGFETDVRLTKDRRIVVLHDDTLDRTTTGAGRVEEQTAVDLAPVRTKKTGQPLTYLEELLDFIKSKPDAFVQVEIKCGKYPESDLAEMCSIMTKQVAEKDVSKQVVFICFEPRAIKKIKELNPKQATCLVSADVGPKVIETAKAVGAEYLSVQINKLYRAFVQDAHKEGLKVTAWTVQNAADAQLAIALGTDCVTTDIPAAQLEQKTARP